MDTELIARVKERLGSEMICSDHAAARRVKHEAARQAFGEMVKLTGVDSLDLFDRIHQCFEAHSLQRPYHDWYHTCCVVEGTIQGLRHLTDGLPEMTETHQKNANGTIIAAAFHDIGHTGVKEPDIVNVSRSTLIAHRFLSDYNLLDKDDLSFSLETLQSTQYPFREPSNEYQAILRDADLLQILEPTWFDDLYVNMYQEFLDGSPDLDFTQFCLREMDFIKSAKFHSWWFTKMKRGVFTATAIYRVEQAYKAVCSLSEVAA